MTPFAALQSLCGLSNREAASFLDMTESAVEKFRRGAKKAPPGALHELQNLWTVIDQAAVDAAEAIGREGLLDAAGGIEIGYPADDYEAEQLGLPCVGAWRQMLARMIDELMLINEGFDPARLVLVPRGSTLATAAAADIHRK
ncbi:MAG: hypothetical protein U0942_15770 [Parvibaculum sp.]|uniref:hypothetical protein n=1 Tax=Parvibaculum sp. TaxID=2024848 RepID=UPI002AB8463F|nr:hypothetical protein [Parvibaculum sp.]MDZ4382789.1 hypothetical protein [Parvibaculum sp.]